MQPLPQLTPPAIRFQGRYHLSGSYNKGMRRDLQKIEADSRIFLGHGTDKYTLVVTDDHALKLMTSLGLPLDVSADKATNHDRVNTWLENRRNFVRYFQALTTLVLTPQPSEPPVIRRHFSRFKQKIKPNAQSVWGPEYPGAYPLPH